MKKPFSLSRRLICWLLTAALLTGGYIFICTKQNRRAADDTVRLLEQSMETASFPDTSRGMLGIVTDDAGLIRTWQQLHLDLSLADAAELAKKAESLAADSGTVYYNDVKYRFLRESLASGSRLALAECGAEQKTAAKMQRGGYAVMAADLILLPVFLLLRKRKRAAAEPDKEG